MKLKTTTLGILTIAALGLGMSSCKEKSTSEKVADEIEDAADEVGDAVEDAADDVKDATENATE